MPRDNPEQIPFAYKLYKRTDVASVALAAGFKKTFCRGVKIEFVGVWCAHTIAIMIFVSNCGCRRDTVASVGSLISKTLPFVANNVTIKTFRHALSLDEVRCQATLTLRHVDADIHRASIGPSSAPISTTAPVHRTSARISMRGSRT